jgi:hypothetical protein
MQIMVSADENRPIEGSGQISAKTKPPGDKPEKRRRKTSKKTKQKPAQDSAAEPEAVVDVMEPLPETLEPADMPADSAETVPAAASTGESAPAAPAAEPEAPTPISVQAITDAYGSYTRKSIEQTSSFLEQLAGTRSLNKAFELQAEFAQAAFDTFVDESRKIRELHRELAKQRLQSFEGFVMGRHAAR